MTVSESAENKKKGRTGYTTAVMKNDFQKRIPCPNCEIRISEDLLPTVFQYCLKDSFQLNTLSRNMPP